MGSAESAFPALTDHRHGRYIGESPWQFSCRTEYVRTTASVMQAFRAALHLLDCSRQSLGYPKPLDALHRRLLKFTAAAERAYHD
jgi:hypothetical protein